MAVAARRQQAQRPDCRPRRTDLVARCIVDPGQLLKKAFNNASRSSCTRRARSNRFPLESTDSYSANKLALIKGLSRPSRQARITCLLGPRGPRIAEMKTFVSTTMAIQPMIAFALSSRSRLFPLSAQFCRDDWHCRRHDGSRPSTQGPQKGAKCRSSSFRRWSSRGTAARRPELLRSLRQIDTPCRGVPPGALSWSSCWRWLDSDTGDFWVVGQFDPIR